MADHDMSSSFDYLGSDEGSDLPPTSVTHLRKASSGARLARTLLTCAVVGGVFTFMVPLLPNTDSKAALHAAKTGDQVASVETDQSGLTASATERVGAYRQDVSYMHAPEHYGRQRI